MRRPRTLHGQFSFHGPFSCRLTARKSAAGDSFAGAVMMNVSWFPQAHKGTASFKNAHVGPLPLRVRLRPGPRSSSPRRLQRGSRPGLAQPPGLTLECRWHPVRKGNYLELVTAARRVDLTHRCQRGWGEGPG